jgi:hypothetical protein
MLLNAIIDSTVPTNEARVSMGTPAERFCCAPAWHCLAFLLGGFDCAVESPGMDIDNFTDDEVYGIKTIPLCSLRGFRLSEGNALRRKNIPERPLFLGIRIEEERSATECAETDPSLFLPTVF